MPKILFLDNIAACLHVEYYNDLITQYEANNSHFAHELHTKRDCFTTPTDYSNNVMLWTVDM